MYTFITEDSHEFKKAKSINENVDDDELKYEDNKNVLFNRSYMRHEMKIIQSKYHKIGLIDRTSLSSYDDKKGYCRVL